MSTSPRMIELAPGVKASRDQLTNSPYSGAFYGRLFDAYLKVERSPETGKYKWALSKPSARRTILQLLRERGAQVNLFRRLDVQPQWEQDELNAPPPPYINNWMDKYSVLKFTKVDFEVIDPIAREIRSGK